MEKQVPGEQKSAIDAYHDLDVGRDSALVKDLFGKIDEEAGSPEIILSGDADPGSPAEGLTSRMQNWHTNHVSYLRDRAIAEAQAVASKIILGEGTLGTIEQVELDKAKRHRAERRTEELNTFQTNNAGLLSKLSETKREYDSLYIQENKRDPKLPPSRLHEGILLHAIMIPEALINFPIIAASSYVPTGFAALALTYIIGFLFGLAGILEGKYLKGFKFYTTPDNPKRRHKGWVLVSLGAIALSTGMVMVIGFRYFNVMETIALAIQLGTPVPNAIVSTLTVSVGNLAVFVIGTIFATHMYDENPDYAEKAKKLKGLEVQRERKKKDLRKILDEISAKCRQDCEQIKNVGLQMKGQSKYATLQSLLTTIESKDNKIAGVYGDYKEKLSKKISQQDPDFTFSSEYSLVNDIIDKKPVSISSFLNRTTVLYWA